MGSFPAPILVRIVNMWYSIHFSTPNFPELNRIQECRECDRQKQLMLKSDTSLYFLPQMLFIAFEMNGTLAVHGFCKLHKCLRFSTFGSFVIVAFTTFKLVSSFFLQNGLVVWLRRGLGLVSCNAWARCLWSSCYGYGLCLERHTFHNKAKNTPINF